MADDIPPAQAAVVRLVCVERDTPQVYSHDVLTCLFCDRPADVERFVGFEFEQRAAEEYARQ